MFAVFQLFRPFSIGEVAGLMTIAGVVAALIAFFIVKKRERHETLDLQLNKTQTDLIASLEKTLKLRTDERDTEIEHGKAKDARIATLETDNADSFAEYQTLAMLYIKDRIQTVAWREENIALHVTIEALRAEVAERGGDPFRIERAAIEHLKLTVGADAAAVLKGTDGHAKPR